MQGPDDLEDNFIIDHNLATLSDGEGYDGVLLSDFSENSENKRKRKRGVKENERKPKKQKPVRNTGPGEFPVANQTPRELSIYLSSLQAKVMPGLSSLELEDMQIPAHSIVDTAVWNGARTLDTLVNFVATVLPTLHARLGQRPKDNGSPTLLFVAEAALRVADVTRVLKDKQLRGDNGGDVAKLFAKHFKLGQHVAYLQRTKIGAAVGTPGRIGKLLRDTGALSVSDLSHIILDVTHKDAKKRSLFDIPEVANEILRSVLGAPEVLKGIKEGRIQLVLF